MGSRFRFGKSLLFLSGLIALILPIGFTPITSNATETEPTFTASISGEGGVTLDQAGAQVNKSVQEDTFAESISVISNKNGVVGYEIIQHETLKKFTPPPPVEEENGENGLVEGVDYHLGDETLVVKEKISQEDMKPLEASDFSLARVISVSPNSISIAWTEKADAHRYEVLLDGQLISTNQKSGVTLTGLTSEKHYTVEVQAIGYVDGSEHVTDNSAHHIYVPSKQKSDNLNEVRFTDVLPAATGTSARALRYVTFITNNRVPADLLSTFLCDLSSGDSSGGDNRGFSLPVSPIPVEAGPSFRTGFEVIADFNAPPAYQTIYQTRAVSPTKKYNSSGTLVETRQAPNTGMVLQNPQLLPDSYATFMMSHSVGNRFCDSGAIRYNVSSAHIYNSGTITVNGTRHPVPAHEMYGLFNNAGTYQWSTMYRGNQGDFWCLSGLCPVQSISNQITI